MRLLSAFSTELATQSTIHSLLSHSEYSFDSLSSVLTFEKSSLFDVDKFRDTVLWLYENLDLPVASVNDVYAMASHYLSWGYWYPHTLVFQDDWTHIGVKADALSVSLVKDLVLCCMMNRCTHLTVFTKSKDPAYMEIVRLVVQRDVQHHYVTEKVVTELIQDKEIRVGCSNPATGELNSEFSLVFVQCDDFRAQDLDLLITTTDDELPLQIIGEIPTAAIADVLRV